MKERRVYAGYDLSGTALNQYQAGSFLAPISYAADKGEGYLKLFQQNKYISHKIYLWITTMMQR